ncbi:hypothetical protein [Kitasatospora sp. MAP5-34]|uniref:hypothetical protein n=1 Tax=Kitasatospora sp. MAP5-34 TaxID=3035102 RepID=UPI002475D705|nr:hypothetical protein [Kitasatospora sp. MAP5-34]MDH6576176.1 hypothetical protein [Kitasatospora sp. MAP5-34]
MSRLRTAMGVALLSATATLALPVSAAQAAPGGTVNTCASSLTPGGWVDVQWWFSASCGSNFSPNAKQIEQLTGLPIGTTVNACSSTYPPAGWIPVASYYSNGCQYSSVPSFDPNTWTLRRVS